MAGYSRQSAADIVPTAVVRATPINNEFNALRDAFDETTGHKHDGTTDEGPFVPVIADVDGNNSVEVNTTNNTVEVSVEVGGSPVKQVVIADGAIKPETDDDVDLGASDKEFKNLYLDGTANIDTLVADTADINGGNIDGTVIGASTPAAATVTNLTVNTAATIASADINAGTIDGTVIGASTPAAATVTNLTVNTAATIASADINAGTIDGAVIGGTSAQAITGTTITASTGFTGDITGNVTGDVTGDVTGNVTGDVTGDVTGNVTASSGTSTFNDVTINGTLNMDASTAFTITNLTAPSDDLDAATKKYVDDADDLKLNLAGGTMSGAIAMGTNKITGVGDPTLAQDAATKNYVDTQVANLVDSAPEALDTLNELAAALDDDANFATTVADSIATKLPLAGGTMTGAIAMGTNKITGVGDPTLDQDAATKKYVDDADDLKLDLAGGTMTGAIAMGTSKITGLGTPTADADAATKKYVDDADALNLPLAGGTMTGNIVMGANKVTSTATPSTDNDLTRKAYVDGILGSATSAADSAAAAATSASNAATSASNASTSETNAATSASNAAASYDAFDDRYLGSKSSAPTLDNDGDALLEGALYWNSVSKELFVYNGSAWEQSSFDAGDFISTETDPVVGAVTGIVKADGAGTISAAVAGTDYYSPSGGTITGDVTVTGNIAGDSVMRIHSNDASRGSIQISAPNDGTNRQVSFGNNFYISGTSTFSQDSIAIGGSAIVMSAPNGNYGDFLFKAKQDPDAGGAVSDRMLIANNGDISFYEDTGTTPKFFWDAGAESLGIGTTSPGLTRLMSVANGDYDAAIQVTSNASATNWARLDVKNQNATGPIILYQEQGGSGYLRNDNPTGVLAFLTAGSNERMRIDGVGNVGIGTSSPANKIDVVDYALAPSLTANTGLLRLQSFTSNEVQIGAYPTSPFAAWIQTKQTNNSGSTFPLALNPLGGNVGIGTNSPSAKLDVNGTANITGNLTLAEYTETVYSLTGTAIDPANGTIQTKTLAANTTFTDSLTAGQSVLLMITGGDTYTVTWPTITWVSSTGDTAPTLTASDTVVLWKISTTLYGAYVGSYA